VSCPHWILCERTTRWAAALYTALARAQSPASPPHLSEARSLTELASRLADRTASLVLVEVSRANLGEVLSFLADSTSRHSEARFAALLTSDFSHHATDQEDATAALFEAGACEVANSPRRLQGILALGQRQVELTAARAAPAANLPLEAAALAQLPWQDDGGPIG
jgi:hypothetical protein